MIKLAIIGAPKSINTAKLRTVARTAYNLAGFHLNIKLSLAFITKKQMKQMNSQFSGNNYATDVLSFVYEDESNDFYADVAICTPIAKNQAKLYKVSLQNEVSLLLIHAILHVLGLDHKSATEKAGFSQLQDGIMKELSLTLREYV